jgi:hypothetical protein
VSLLVVFVTILVIAALTGIMASESIRSRIFGNRRYLSALVPLVAAASVWAADAMLEFLGDKVSDSSVPASQVSVFIEDVSFGYPGIPDTYKEKRLIGEELRRFLQPFTDVRTTIAFTPDETKRLNDLAMKSGQIRQLNEGQAYSMKDLEEILGGVLYYYEYIHWKAILDSWASFLREQSEKGNQPEATVDVFVESLMRQITDATGIYSAIVGMAARGNVIIPSASPRPGEQRIPWIQWEESTQHGGWCIHFRTFAMLLAKSEEFKIRRDAAQRLYDLFSYGRVEQIREVLVDASSVLGQEAEVISEHAAELDRILASRRSKRLVVIATISNIGKFDAFFRKEAKIAVGPQGRGTEKIPVILMAESFTDESATYSDKSPYFCVPSRQAVTVEFTTDLSDSLSDRLHGSYTSGFTYLQLGLVANAGKAQQDCASAPTPFSTAARTAATKRVDDIPMRF